MMKNQTIHLLFRSIASLFLAFLGSCTPPPVPTSPSPQQPKLENNRGTENNKADDDDGKNEKDKDDDKNEKDGDDDKDDKD